MHFKICLFVLISISELQAKPFLLSVPRALSNFVSSASSSASSYVFSAPQSLTSAEPAISDLRQRQSKLDDDDDFFKDEPSAQNPSTTTPSSLLQLKIGKILEKIRLLSQLSGGPASPSSDDDFQKEQEEFDKEFEEDTNKKQGAEEMTGSASLKSSSGYFYPKPASPWKSGDNNVKKSEKLSETGRFSFNPESFGVYLMEIVGSLVGLAYGAAAQLNAPSGVTNPP